MNPAQVAKAANLIRSARHVVVLTGAGISTPSGIPDFRSPRSGLWEQADPATVASIWGFRRDPAAFYAWLRPLAQAMAQAQPNQAHQALAAMEKAGLVKAVITQNIDGLHQKAGSQRVFELHGHVRTAICLRCGRETPAAEPLAALLETGRIPRCAGCGGVLKPNVVLYGELLPEDVFLAAEAEANACDLMWVVGSSLTVAPASLLPEEAIRRRALLVIVNRMATELDGRAAVVLRDDVAEVLPAIAVACGVEGW